MLTATDSTAESPKAVLAPYVSIIMPVYNEEKFIKPILEAVLQQDYPANRFEVIVADGMSTDRTAELVRSIQAAHPNVRLIDNPDRIVPTGLNRAIACARGDIIVRLDGHCEYPKDYVRRVVELRQKLGADNVGGVLVPLGKGYIQSSVAAAYYSRVGVGGRALSAAPGAHEVVEVDAVHGGCWTRERLLAAGGFDETMVRNQDDELSFRLRKSSGKIYQATELRVQYHVRNSFRKLFMQFAQYGYWKVQVVRKHPQQASLRHLVPALFILSLFAMLAFAPLSKGAAWGLAIVLGGYLSALVLATAVQLRGFVLLPGVVAALIMMHWGYGLGFIIGCLRLCMGPLPTDRIFEKVTR